MTGSVKSKEVTFTSSIPEKGRRSLQGTITLPDNGLAQHPAVVLIHGSGPNNRDARSPGDLLIAFEEPVPIFAQLADHLTQLGFAVLRYDKRSCVPCYGGVKHSFEDFLFSDFATDAKDAVAYLAGRPDILPGAIVVAGHSQGGQFAPYIAATNHNVAAVVMLAGPLDNFADGVLGQLDRVTVLNESNLRYMSAWSTKLLVRDKLQLCFDKLKTSYDPNEFCIGGGVTQRALKEYVLLGDGTADALRDLEVPIFAVQGSLDRNIDPTDIVDMKTALKGHDAEFHYIAGVNHALTNTLQPSEPPGIDSTVLERLDTFLATVPYRQTPPTAP